MKKLKYLFMGLFVAMVLTGCSNNLKEGTYYSISDEWGKVKLSVSDDDKVSIDYVSVNDAIDKAIDSSFINKLFADSLNESKITLKGTIDKKKKEFHFTEPKEMTAQYVIENGTIIMSDKNDEDFKQTFYVEADKKLDDLMEEFKKNTNGTPTYVKNLMGTDDYDTEGYEENSDDNYDNKESADSEESYSKESEKKTNQFKSEDIAKTANLIKEDFLKSMIGAWMGGKYEIQGVESTLNITDDKTFTATYTSQFGSSDINYTGKFDFSESTALEDKIAELLKKETISSLKEIDSYSKYSSIFGKYDNSIEFKFATSFTGTDSGKDISKSDIVKIVKLNLNDNHLNFNEVLYDTIRGISVEYYVK